MLIGREIPEYRDNANRTRFNDMLRAEYGGKDPIFDIAKLESTAGGSRNVFEYDGQKVEALVPAYTNDGGHLSDEGKRWIAEQLLIFLAELNYKQ
jgi:lysophospholipase L1-like esterase